MFPGSAKLWLEAQPQAESEGCLQISFRVFKIFFLQKKKYYFQLAGLGVAPIIIWTTALGSELRLWFVSLVLYFVFFYFLPFYNVVFPLLYRRNWSERQLIKQQKVEQQRVDHKGPFLQEHSMVKHKTCQIQNNISSFFITK